MALPFLAGRGSRKRNQMISVDLGARTTKAVLLEQRGDVWALTRFAVLDAPIVEKKISPELLTEHLKAVVEALGTKVKSISMAVSLDDAVVRLVDLPHIPVDEMRLVLKNNSKTYLQQDLPGHIFDCYIIPPKERVNGKPAAETSKASGGFNNKLKVFVAAAKSSYVNDFQTAVKEAGLVAEHMVPGFVSLANAFEFAKPEVFKNESVALVDIGFRQTSICVLDGGEPVLMRVVNIGGDKLTTGLAETMSISYAEAEGIKIGMAPEVMSSLEMHVQPLGRELRASLDFFEHQNDRAISEVYVSGGSARSEMILQILQTEMIAECKTWNPTTFLQMALPGQQAVEVEHVGSQLTVAVGAALAAIT
jgi:type IV pilus assembly protein PilM